MKNKVALICLYFGSLPNYFQLYLNSCEFNKEFNWIIFTDCNKTYKVPKNVKLVVCSFESIINRITAVIDFQPNIISPYKLCDFRPLYGIIFENELYNYSHWGHTDLDMIYGDLGKYITDELLDKYDKVFDYGHLSIYKNNKTVNAYYQLPYKGIDYRRILCSSNHYGFDEFRGMNKIMKDNNLPVFSQSYCADINFKYYKLRIVNSENVKNQTFVFDEGKIFCYDFNGNYREYIYIHLQKRKMDINSSVFNRKKYYINDLGFDVIKSHNMTFNKYLAAIIYFFKKEVEMVRLKLEWNLHWRYFK